MKKLLIVLSLLLVGTIGNVSADALQSCKLAKFDNGVKVYSITYKGVEYLIVSNSSSESGIAIIPVVQQKSKKKAQLDKATDTFRNTEW